MVLSFFEHGKNMEICGTLHKLGTIVTASKHSQVVGNISDQNSSIQILDPTNGYRVVQKNVPACRFPASDLPITQELSSMFDAQL